MRAEVYFARVRFLPDGEIIEASYGRGYVTRQRALAAAWRIFADGVTMRGGRAKAVVEVHRRDLGRVMALAVEASGAM